MKYNLTCIFLIYNNKKFMQNINVKLSSFSNFHKTGNGGVFELSSVNIDIECCLFEFISVDIFGGCIYASNSNLNLERSSFNNCRVLTT